MKHRAILNVKFGVYPVIDEKCASTYVHSGQAVKIISGQSLEECVGNVKEYLKNVEINLIKEEDGSGKIIK